jgi:dihydrofolate synthase/folylpolyglutamate synthase
LQSLDGWLEYISGLHYKAMDLGLERVGKVRDALGRIEGESSAPVVISVGGTNGKGSTCAMLEAILLASGYRVGLYTSPHLLRYTERVRIQGEEIAPDKLVAAFAEVEAARKRADNVSLTYFEFGTLAAWQIFASSKLDVVILEVGLGGRLDAVNAFEPDCSVITSVDIDHVEFLGSTREAIGLEKAGIFRSGKPAVVADPVPPKSLLDHAASIGADLRLIGRDFGYQGDRQQWGYWGRGVKRPGMAFPALRGANQLLNASAALAALDSLRERIPVAMGGVRSCREGLPSFSMWRTTRMQRPCLPRICRTWDSFRRHMACSACWRTRTSRASANASRTRYRSGISRRYRGRAGLQRKCSKRRSCKVGSVGRSKGMIHLARPTWQRARQQVKMIELLCLVHS